MNFEFTASTCVLTFRTRRIDAVSAFRNGLSCSEDAIVAGSQGFVQSPEPMSSCKRVFAAPLCSEMPWKNLQSGRFMESSWVVWRPRMSKSRATGISTRDRMASVSMAAPWGVWMEIQDDALAPPRIGGNLHKSVTFPGITGPQAQPARMVK
jgi:hypothetical protein